MFRYVCLILQMKPNIKGSFTGILKIIPLHYTMRKNILQFILMILHCLYCNLWILLKFSTKCLQNAYIKICCSPNLLFIYKGKIYMKMMFKNEVFIVVCVLKVIYFLRITQKILYAISFLEWMRNFKKAMWLD